MKMEERVSAGHPQVGVSDRRKEAPAVLWATGEGKAKVEGDQKPPQAMHAGSDEVSPARVTTTQVKEEPEDGQASCWETQWQEFLKMVGSPPSEQEIPEEATPWGDTRAFLDSFEQVAKACRWPREEWVARLLPALSGEAEMTFRTMDAGEKEDYGKVKMALLRRDALSREKNRQRFRRFCYLEAKGPRATYDQLQRLCWRWLEVERHTKEQILEVLILEQFLVVLPPETQSWVRERGPETCSQAVALAEAFLLKQQEVERIGNQANVSQLKTFLSAVKLAHRGTNEETLPLSALVPAKASEVEKPKTKMTITSKKDYPLTRNFPYSLEHLQASYCKLARVDMRMLCLKSLRKLDLSHNRIKKLPATIGDLVCLQELNLQDNHLESFNVALCNSTLQKSLRSLDLSQNKIRALPAQFCQLRELIHLKLDDNHLIRLPFKIGQLSQLRFLSVARNKLPFLPSEFAKLSLESLDLFGNPFEQPTPLLPEMRLEVPLTLLECAARASIHYR
ncbi:hypothetical protein JD844_020248 [Phrynosoma platyrhinos]|uniref:SCAN box domain-containing protein n=1 Tax=Phrynosoma platyrhinos TaxID=52577 RepID=A0ABQ7SSB0_PHRPL|nr:hypothetical protein JD844_020248 [Phrynosoma platyrhinos]